MKMFLVLTICFLLIGFTITIRQLHTEEGVTVANIDDKDFPMDSSTNDMKTVPNNPDEEIFIKPKRSKKEDCVIQKGKECAVWGEACRSLNRVPFNRYYGLYSAAAECKDWKDTTRPSYADIDGVTSNCFATSDSDAPWCFIIDNTGGQFQKRDLDWRYCYENCTDVPGYFGH